MAEAHHHYLGHSELPWFHHGLRYALLPGWTVDALRRQKGAYMNKGIIGFIGGMVTGVILTLAAASLIPEDYVFQDRH